MRVVPPLFVMLRTVLEVSNVVDATQESGRTFVARIHMFTGIGTFARGSTSTLTMILVVGY